MKLTKRKAFNFLRSYFDVLNKLQTDEDKLAFLMAVINKQFLNEDPEELKFPVDLAYDSQINAIDSSVKGWLRASKTDLQGKPLDTPPTPPRGKTQSDPKEEEEEEKEKEEEKHILVKIDFDGLLIFLNEVLSKSYRLINTSTRQKYKARLTEGYTKEDIFTAIKNASTDKFHIDNGYKHLTPEYFSRAKSLDLHNNGKELTPKEKMLAKHNYKPMGA